MESILDAEEDEVTILDLSEGHLLSPSTLRKEVDDLLKDTDKTIHWIDGQRYASVVGRESRDAYLDWLSHIADDELIDGKSVKQIFTYRGEISLWWFTPAAYKSVDHHPFRWLFYMIHVVRHLVEETVNKSSTWHVWVDDAATGDVLSAAIRDQKAVQVHQYSENGEDRSSGLIDQIKGWLQPLVGVLWVLRMALFSSRTLRPLREDGEYLVDRSKRGLVLIHSTFPKNWRSATVFDKCPDDWRFFDHYFSDAPRKLREQRVNVGWLPELNPNDFEDWMSARNKQTLPDALPWLTLARSASFVLIWHQAKWALLYIWYFGIRQIHRQWMYQGISFAAWLKQEYRALCLGNKGVLEMMQVERHRSACDALQPKVILFTRAFDYGGRRVAAATKGRTKLIGVQYRMLNREDTVYQFRSRDIPNSQEPFDGIQHCPVPDWYAALGQQTVEMFDEWGGYPAGQVLPVGGLRYDLLGRQFVSSKDPREELQRRARERLDLPGAMPVVLLCTGHTTDVMSWVGMTLDACRQLGEEIFLVAEAKAHFEQRIRGDGEAYSSVHLRIRNSVNPLLIGASDVLIAGNATVTLEANYLGTGVISLVADAEYNVYAQGDEQVGWPVRDAKSMRDALRVIIAGQPVEKMRKKMRPERWLNNADGEATRRLCRLVQSEL